MADWGMRSLAARRRLGLTQREISRRARTSPATLSRFEAGERGISDSLKVRLADALEVDTDSLFSFSHVPARAVVPPSNTPSPKESNDDPDERARLLRANAG